MKEEEDRLIGIKVNIRESHFKKIGNIAATLFEGNFSMALRLVIERWHSSKDDDILF